MSSIKKIIGEEMEKAKEMIVTTNITVPKGVNDLSGNAQSALALGDTQLAQNLREEAGKLLEREAAGRRATGEKHLIRFLAATQYYKGGMFPKAVKVSQKIEQKLLPAEFRQIFAKFRNDLKERCSSKYENKIRKLMKERFEKRQFEKVIEILQEHPYILPAARLAFVRACCCERLGDFRTATLFYADITKYDPDEFELSFYSAASPMSLIPTDLAKAWEIVEKQLDKVPHVLTFVTASLARFGQASSVLAKKKREQYYDEQIKYFREAWNKYEKLTADLQKRKDILNPMLYCLEASAITYWRKDEDEMAAEVCNQAIAIAPTTPSVWTLRGMVKYPGDCSVSDFEKAIQLGEEHFYPFYYLAHASITRDHFVDAASFCEKAIKHNPNPAIEAQLRKWLAIAEKAQKLKPTNSRIKHNTAKFKIKVGKVKDSASQKWNQRKNKPNCEPVNFLPEFDELSRMRDDSVYFSTSPAVS